MRLDDDSEHEDEPKAPTPRKYIRDDVIRDPGWAPYRPSRDRAPQRERKEAPEPTIQVHSAWVVTE